jgi:hypothetical protein
VSKQDIPINKLVAVERASGIDFEMADLIRRELGLDGLTVTLPLDFDDPAFSRQMLELESFGCFNRFNRQFFFPQKS